MTKFTNELLIDSSLLLTNSTPIAVGDGATVALGKLQAQLSQTSSTTTIPKWKLANSYIADQPVSNEYLIYTANNTILANTPFVSGYGTNEWTLEGSAPLYKGDIVSANVTLTRFANHRQGWFWVCTEDSVNIGGIVLNYNDVLLANININGAVTTLIGNNFSIVRSTTNAPRQYDSAKPWTNLAFAILGNLNIQSNTAIPENTTFAWGANGDTSATWRPILINQLKWKGVFSATTNYLANDVVVGGTSPSEIFYTFISDFTAQAVDPILVPSLMRPISNLQAVDYSSAVFTSPAVTARRFTQGQMLVRGVNTYYANGIINVGTTLVEGNTGATITAISKIARDFAPGLLIYLNDILLFRNSQYRSKVATFTSVATWNAAQYTLLVGNPETYLTISPVSGITAASAKLTLAIPTSVNQNNTVVSGGNIVNLTAGTYVIFVNPNFVVDASTGFIQLSFTDVSGITNLMETYNNFIPQTYSGGAIRCQSNTLTKEIIATTDTATFSITATRMGTMSSFSISDSVVTLKRLS